MPNDDEAAERIKAEMDGQPEDWVEAAVEQELQERADLNAWAQAAYDDQLRQNGVVK